MKKRYSISFFAAVIICVVMLSFAYRSSYNHARSQKETNGMETVHKEDPSMPTEGNAKKADTYYLKESNGFVIVYLSDQKTVYEYTSIRMDQLPEDVALEVSEGMPIETEESLYSFLESYSS